MNSWSQNITINNNGEVVLVLGTYFIAGDDIEELFSDRNSSFYDFIKLSLLDEMQKDKFEWCALKYTPAKSELKGKLQKDMD